MTPRGDYDLPPDKEALFRRAARLEWVSIGFLLSIIAVMVLTAGASQAMKTAWIEDTLSLVPPIAFLVAGRYRHRSPDANYPYGRHRAVSIAYLCGSVALLAVGVFLVVDAGSTLAHREHPTIGFVSLLGWDVWEGWLMVAALVYSVIPPVILGHLKLGVARKIHDKALFADASMNRADWLTGLFAIAGVVGIALGFWWADAVAAAIISIDVIRDGLGNVRNGVAELVDRAPQTVEGDDDPIDARVERAIGALDWVQHAAVRLREEGHVLEGEAFVVARPDLPDLVDRLAEIPKVARAVDWRIHELVVQPVRHLDGPAAAAEG